MIFWNSRFFDDPADVGILISGSSAFYKSILNIWKFTFHVLLTPGLENFEHCFTLLLYHILHLTNTPCEGLGYIKAAFVIWWVCAIHMCMWTNLCESKHTQTHTQTFIIMLTNKLFIFLSIGWFEFSSIKFRKVT